MSSWPLISDFSRMLQNPQVAFRDPRFKQCLIEMDNLGQPKPRSGNFATVYRGYLTDGTPLAFKVFNRKADQRRERYQSISRYLDGRGVSSLVRFEYDEKGIRSASDGKLYPLLMMEWVNGVTLFEWCRDRSREGYQEALATGALAWLELVRELAAQRIVHGDLQHANVMVSAEGYFKLVDYDGMCVPELLGQPNLETGLEPYQHPARNADTQTFGGLDNFSALVIYVALRALAAAPGLWATFVDAPGYDKLLFRKEDFVNPAGSALCQALEKSPDPTVRGLAKFLFELTRWQIRDVPRLDEALLRSRPLDELLAARDWDTAVRLLESMPAHEQIPMPLAGLAAAARQRVRCRQAMEVALKAGDDTELIRSYSPQLMDDYPAAAALVAQAQRAGQALRIFELLKAARERQEWDVFKQTWQANRELFEDRPSAKPYKEEMARLLTVHAIGKLLADPQAEDEALASAWRYLMQLGGHPTCEPLRGEVERRIARQRRLGVLKELVESAPRTYSAAHDEQVAAAWSPELANSGGGSARLADYCRAALRRLDRLKKLQHLASERSFEGTREIAAAARELPADYHADLKRVVQEARLRLAAYGVVQQAIAENQSEQTIARAWKKLVKAGGKSMLSPSERSRVEIAARRAEMLKQLEGQLSAAIPPSDSARRILAIWDPELLDNCPEAARWKSEYQRARKQQDALAELERAVAAGESAEAERLLDQSAVRGALLSPELLRGIDQVRQQAAQARLAQRQALIQALLGGDRGAFARLFDAALIGEICAQCPHHQPVASRWVETEILPLNRSGLAADLAALERIDAGSYRARWIWPPASVTGHCRLAVCRQRPNQHASPDDIGALYAASIDRAAWEADGEFHFFAVQKDWKNCLVLVWAQVDLGFQVFYSDPLEVGQLAVEQKPQRWKLFG